MRSPLFPNKLAAVLTCMGLAALVVLPVWSVYLPPLSDYPNHLARMYLLSLRPLPEQLAQYYQPFLHWQPNLAMDLIVPGLAQVMPLWIAGKVFLSLTLLSMLAGTAALYFAVHRQLSAWLLLSLLFVYNRFFLWGFANFLFSLGMALAGVAVWIVLQQRHPLLRLLVSCVVAVAVYLGHLYAFGVYCLLVGGFTLQVLIERFRRERRIDLGEMCIAAAQLVMPVLLFFFVSPTAQRYSDSYWGSLYRKLEAPFDVLYNYHLGFDAATLVVMLLLAGFGFWRGYIRFAPSMAVPVLFLAIAFFIMPDKLFTSYGADRRLSVAFVFVLIAATDWALPSAAWRRGLAASAAALLVVRIGLILWQWQASNVVYRDYLKAIDMIPVGAKMTAVLANDSGLSLPPTPLFEISMLAIIRRQAAVPLLFSYPRDAAQGIRLTAKMEAMAAVAPPYKVETRLLEELRDPAVAARKSPYRPAALRPFDYLLLTNEKAIPLPVPDFLQPVYVGDNFRLLRVKLP